MWRGMICETSWSGFYLLVKQGLILMGIWSSTIIYLHIRLLVDWSIYVVAPLSFDIPLLQPYCAHFVFWYNFNSAAVFLFVYQQY